MNILDTMQDRALFGRWFQDQATWSAWRTFLRCLFALPLDDDARELFTQCTGRLDPPEKPCREAALICGRRSGKSFTLALIGAFLATMRDWSPYLMPGEVGTLPIIAADRRQARTIMRYLRSLLLETPMLASMVEAEGAERIDLLNRVTVEVHTCSFRSVRGYTVLSALLDEVAFWRADDSSEPDHLVIDALRPAMATVPDAMLLMASSPWSKRGALFDMFRLHYGKEVDPVLVWRADTRTMNPTVPLSVIDDAYERDAQSAAAEYGAEFRADVDTYITKEAVENCITPGVVERAPHRELRYFGFTDVSAGASDSMVTAVAHLDGDRVVLDAVREQPSPFNPEATVQEHAAFLRSYRISTLQGDRFAGQWPVEVWRRHGINYTVAQRTKSDIYRDALPRLNTGAVDLLDLPRLRYQLLGLERTTKRGTGKEVIDHAPGAKDDVVTAALGAVLAVQVIDTTLIDEAFRAGEGLRAIW
jgi:hypothetical protein